MVSSGFNTSNQAQGYFWVSLYFMAIVTEMAFVKHIINTGKTKLSNRIAIARVCLSSYVNVDQSLLQ